MKYVDEYRKQQTVAHLIERIRQTAHRRWTVMEICGGQTHSIVRFGIDQLLPETVELVHWPGCPVCVTPLQTIDRAHAIALQKNVIFCSFGDMLRVPGSDGDLLSLKARGADIRVVYSPLDAVGIASLNPNKKVVFFAIGFETTAPANAMALVQARNLALRNFSVLVSHVLVPPAIASILQTPGNRVQGFLGPGHVCTVTGTAEYEAITRHYRVPVVITGFEPVDILGGILSVIRQLEAGQAELVNAYARVVRSDGNPQAQRLLHDVFDVCDQNWRGVGSIPKSGYRLSYEYQQFDALNHFDVAGIETKESSTCISGQILRGLKKPEACPAFGRQCTPETPLGATMVSAEGACAAYYAYRRKQVAS